MTLTGFFLRRQHAGLHPIKKTLQNAIDVLARCDEMNNISLEIMSHGNESLEILWGIFRAVNVDGNTFLAIACCFFIWKVKYM